MRNKDELLQQQLDALEKGDALDEVLSRLVDEDEQLAPLIRLAAAIRSMPHPDPVLERAPGQVARAAALARSGKRASEKGLKGYLDRFFRPPFSVAVPALVGVTLVALIAFVSLSALGIGMVGPRQAQAAVLVDVSGQVEVATNEEGSSWESLAEGDRIRSGARLRTLEGSTATLDFYEGSRTVLTPGTELILVRVDGGWGKTLQVVIDQTVGATSNSITPLKGSNSLFLVSTPSGIASVHGTRFTVEVDQRGRSRFAVTSGKVQVSNDASEVFLLSGQVLSVEPGLELTSPSYQFSIQGELESIQGNIWTVSGMYFTVLEETTVYGDPAIADGVQVEGHVLESGEWIADSITRVEAPDPNGSFTGILDNDQGEEWQIGDWTVLVTGETELDEGLEVGAPVRVFFYVLESGRWQALKIEPIQQPEDEVPPLPDQQAKPSLAFEPDELILVTCAADQAGPYEFSGILSNKAQDPKDFTANVELGYEVIKGSTFVDQVELEPAGWERIEAGQTVNFTIRVIVDAEAWMNAPEDAEVKVRVYLAAESNRPDHLRGRVTATLVSDCEDEDEVEEPEVPDSDDGEEDQEEGAEAGMCTGAQPHPTGYKLADRYGVPYEEIMEWFCQGFGFGEIELAYSLSQEKGIPVGEIFQMKIDGKGWGEIKQELDPKPPKDKAKEAKDKNKDKDK